MTVAFASQWNRLTWLDLFTLFHLYIWIPTQFAQLRIIPPLSKPCYNNFSSKEGCLYLQERPVLRLLLLHLLQQPLDFFSQLCLQLWLDDKVQCGRKRRAQRVNMALQPEIKEEETLSSGTSCSCELTVSAAIWICEWLYVNEGKKKIQDLLTILGSNCHVLYIFMTEHLFCFATLKVLIMVSSKAAVDLNQVHLSSHPRCYDHFQQLKWTVPILMW